MSIPSRNGKFELYTAVSDSLYSELVELAGQTIVSASVWEESLVDALEKKKTPPEQQIAFDIDLYLEGGVYFELYGTLCFPDLESKPIRGLSAVQTRLFELIRQRIWLDEVAVDEDEQLILVLSHQRRPLLYLLVAGWILDGWEDLPDNRDNSLFI